MSKRWQIAVMMFAVVISLTACTKKPVEENKQENIYDNEAVESINDKDDAEDKSYFEGIDLAEEDNVESTDSVEMTVETQLAETKSEETDSQVNGGIHSKVEVGDLLQPPAADSAVEIP